MPWNPFRRAQTLPDNKALNALLVTGAQTPETDRAPLFNELLKSTLIVPLYEPAERSGQGPIKCVMIESQGKRALVGLTDQIALRRFDGEAAFPTALLPARELARIALTGNFDNSGSESGRADWVYALPHGDPDIGRRGRQGPPPGSDGQEVDAGLDRYALGSTFGGGLEQDATCDSGRGRIGSLLVLDGD